MSLDSDLKSAASSGSEPASVSVLVPCHNAEQWVAEAIDSALNQDFSSVEVVVVDDGSTDNSVGILRSYGNRIVWESIPNSGACRARNRALELSSGEFIQYLDADDILLPGKFKSQVPILQSNPGSVVIAHGKVFGDGKGMRPMKQRTGDPAGLDPFVYTLNNRLTTAGPLFPRVMVERSGGFRDGLFRGQDTEFHNRIAALGAKFILQEKELFFAVRNHDTPGRLTQIRTTAEFTVEWYEQLTESLFGGEFQMTELRWSALAGKIFVAGIYAFRNDYPEAAQRAFQLAYSLPCGSFSYPERWWYRILVKSVGPMQAERCLKLARITRNRFRRR